MTNGSFPLGRKHLERYAGIAKVIYRRGFTDLSLALLAQKDISLSQKELEKEGMTGTDDPLPLRFKLALQDLGPSFIKFGQLLSNRPDILPPEFIKELESLQDDVPPVDFKEIRKIIESELGRTPEQLFQFIDEKPFGAASLAQVHKAVLRTGETVAVKVQRPDISKAIEADLEIMAYMAEVLHEKRKSMEYYNPRGLVHAFKETLNRELDYHYEALHIERFRKNFLDNPKVKVPKVYEELSTGCILTMELIDGIKISNLAGMRGLGIDPRDVAQTGVEALFAQVFEHGFFHADPHPGNILVQTDGSITYIDFGMMGHLLPEVKEQVTALFIGIDFKDTRRIIKALKNLSHTHRFEDEDSLRYKISELVEFYSATSLGRISFAELLNSFTQLMVAYRIKIPSEMFLLIKAFTVTEGLGLALDPEMNVVEKLRPLIRDHLKAKFSISGFTRALYLGAIDTGEFLRELPSDLKDIIDKIRYGKLHVEIEHKGLSDFGDKLLQVSNRVAFAILTASLVIGSSLLIHSGVPPVYQGIPIPGVLGFIVSGIFAVRLLLGIWRKGKL